MGVLSDVIDVERGPESDFAITIPPEITTENPLTGPPDGSTTVIITGSNLTGTTRVLFGSSTSSSFTVDSPTRLTAKSPPGSGTSNITVTTDAGTASSGEAFVYESPPNIFSVTPSQGPGTGGTVVTIYGLSLTTATAVTFGDTPATSFVALGPSSIQAVTPAGSGWVTVSITSSVARGVIATAFEYESAPSIASISPKYGTPTGGTSVTITGAGFDDVTGVLFGTTPATSFAVDSYSRITAVTATGAGTVSVSVNTTHGTGMLSAAFTFESEPVISGISPAEGSTNGGTPVEITGAYLTTALTVSFGGSPSPEFTNTGSSIIHAVTPAGTGTVSVSVLTGAGTDIDTSGYTYTDAPILRSIAPNTGPSTGTTAVEITGANFTSTAAVTFGSHPARTVDVVSRNLIDATSPAATAGTVTVSVSTTEGHSSSSGSDVFTYLVGTIAPSTPSSISATETGSTISVSWTPPSSAGTSPVTSYTVTAIPVVPPPDPVTPSCFVADATSCIAFLPPVIHSSDPSGSWSIAEHGMELGSVITGVSCPTRSRCIEVGDLGEHTDSQELLILFSDDAGASWQQAPVPGTFVGALAVSCASASDCVAVAQTSVSTGTQYAHGHFSVIYTTDGGASWSEGHMADETGIHQVTAASCPSEGHCYALAKTPTTGRVVILGSSDSGETWTVVSRPFTSHFEVLGASLYGFGNNLACSTDTDCTAVGELRYTDDPTYWSAIAIQTTNGGETWTSHILPYSGSLRAVVPLSVACPTSSLCYATGLTTTSDHGFESTVWKLPHAATEWEELATVPGSTVEGGESLFLGLACPNGTSCVVTGLGEGSTHALQPVIDRTTDAATSWTDESVATAADQAFAPTTVWCSSLTSCVVAGAVAVDSEGAVSAHLEWGDARWSANQVCSSTTPNEPNSVSAGTGFTRTAAIPISETVTGDSATLRGAAGGAAYEIAVTATSAAGTSCTGYETHLLFTTSTKYASGSAPATTVSAHADGCTFHSAVSTTEDDPDPDVALTRTTTHTAFTKVWILITNSFRRAAEDTATAHASEAGALSTGIRSRSFTETTTHSGQCTRYGWTPTMPSWRSPTLVMPMTQAMWAVKHTTTTTQVLRREPHHGGGLFAPAVVKISTGRYAMFYDAIDRTGVADSTTPQNAGETPPHPKYDVDTWDNCIGVAFSTHIARTFSNDRYPTKALLCADNEAFGATTSQFHLPVGTGNPTTTTLVHGGLIDPDPFFYRTHWYLLVKEAGAHYGHAEIWSVPMKFVWGTRPTERYVTMSTTFTSHTRHPVMLLSQPTGSCGDTGVCKWETGPTSDGPEAPAMTFTSNGKAVRLYFSAGRFEGTKNTINGWHLTYGVSWVSCPDGPTDACRAATDDGQTHLFAYRPPTGANTPGLTGPAPLPAEYGPGSASLLGQYVDGFDAVAYSGWPSNVNTCLNYADVSVNPKCNGRGLVLTVRRDPHNFQGITASEVKNGVAGYLMAEADGTVWGFGSASTYGTMETAHLVATIVGIALTSSGDGYWLVAADGGVFAFGSAAFHGSMGGKPLNSKVVGMAAAPTGRGYWLVAGDGGIFSFPTGDAGLPFYGSMGGKPLNAPVVGMAAVPTGGGYWLVAQDGGIFSFGDAPFHGSLGDVQLTRPISGMAAVPEAVTSTRHGYWLVGEDGGVFTFTAPFWTSLPAIGVVPLGAVTGIAATPEGRGYWLLTSTGGLFALGTALYYGNGIRTTP